MQYRYYAFSLKFVFIFDCLFYYIQLSIFLLKLSLAFCLYCTDTNFGLNSLPFIFYNDISVRKVDTDNSGHITASELQDALSQVNIKLQGFEVRELIRKHDSIVKDEKLNFEEFKQVSLS